MPLTLPAQIRRYTLILGTGWSLTCLVVFVLHYNDNCASARRFALESARESLRKDLIYRRWNAEHGGVYVPITAKSPPNPYLAHLPHRDLVTSSGLRLTLINPALMTRQVHELGMSAFDSKGHITASNPLRPLNRPDPWEEASLRRFAEGETEVSAVTEMDGQSFLRAMVPLTTEEACLPCHWQQGIRIGELYGGLSVMIPMEGYLREAATEARRDGVLLLAMWGVGSALIFFSGRQLALHSRKGQQAREEMIASERRYRQLFDNIDSSFAVCELLCDDDGRPQNYRFLAVNPGYETLTGLAAAKVIGKNATEVLTTNEPAWVERFGKVALGGEPDHFVHFSPQMGKHLGIRVFSPEAGQFAVLATDVTERMQAELEVLKGRQRFEDLVNNTNGIVWELDLSTFRFTFVSQRAESLLGYPLHDWYQENFWVDHLHPEDRDAALHYCMEMTSQLRSHDFEYRMTTRDGRVVWLRDLVSVRAEGGRAVQLFGVMIDITEAKLMLLQLQEFRTALDASHDMVCVLDRDYRCIIANRAYLAMHNAPESRVVGQPLRSFLSNDIFAVIEPYLASAFAGEAVTFEMTRRQSGDSHRQLAVSYTPMHEQGGIPRVVVVIRDVTAARVAEHALERAAQTAEAANRAKTEFLANMSHELRTPLNGVLGMLQLLATTELAPPQQEYVDTATRSGWSLLELLKDLLDLTRIEAGKLLIHQKPFTLIQTLHQLNDLFSIAISEKRLAYDCHLENDLPAILNGDETRIRQILFNLLGNAIKFTPQGGRVELLVTAESPLPSGAIPVCFTVADSGIGIDRESLKTIFNPFVQGENVYQKRYQGAGLGLAIVKRLTEMMAGTIELDSQPGTGTSVKVCLPLHPVELTDGMAREQPAPSLPRPASGLAPRRILLVDDNEINRTTFTMLLQNQGRHQVTVAGNGQEALQHLATAEFDLVLMDIQMPVMDGIAALREIRRGSHGVRNPHVPVIALTAYAMENDREKFLAAGMNDYLAKPVAWQELDECLTRVMGSA